MIHRPVRKAPKEQPRHQQVSVPEMFDIKSKKEMLILIHMLTQTHLYRHTCYTQSPYPATARTFSSFFIYYKLSSLRIRCCQCRMENFTEANHRTLPKGMEFWFRKHTPANHKNIRDHKRESKYMRRESSHRPSAIVNKHIRHGLYIHAGAPCFKEEEEIEGTLRK